MPYVQRRDDVVIGLFANAQPGYAEEWLADDHPDVVAFRNPPPPPRIFSKRAFFLALTDEEYATFEAVEAQQPARDRRAFSEATELNEADDDWLQFLTLMHAAYGEERTAEILDAAAL